MPDEFYIGYAPVPPGVARATRRAAIALAAFAVCACALLILAQQPFPRATFEYGQVRTFAGVLEIAPYPTLLVPRPGGHEYSRYLLAGQGKNGTESGGFRGREVSLRGSLIYRDGHTMIEVESGSLRVQPLPYGRGSVGEVAVVGGSVVLAGEIVDSKCYLGVMNPGRTKVHRDCAARCIRGGIPPMLVTADATYLLAGAEVADVVGETVQVQGDVERSGDTLILRAKKISRRE